MSADNAPPVSSALGVPCGVKERLSWRGKVAWVALALVCLSMLALWGSNLLIPYKVPSASMEPAIMPGERVFSEDVTYKIRPPRRGDIIVFRNDFTAALPDHCYCCKRVAGEPGEHLRITNGQLFINDQLTGLTNESGAIRYEMPPAFSGRKPVTEVVIPPGEYFVLGDNSTNSNDSRFFGFVPANRIVGRVSFCCWPWSRAGWVE